MIENYLIRIKKRKYVSLNVAIISQYIFMVGINIRPYPIFENVEIIKNVFWLLLYLLIPEITYYLLVIYSLIKVIKLNSYLKKIIGFLIIYPNLIFSLLTIRYSLSSMQFFIKIITKS